MKYEKARKTVLDAIQEAVELGLVNGTSGNAAVLDAAERIVAITPSGIPYKGMTADQIAVVDLSGKWIDGPFKPSSELPMHLAVLTSREDVTATIHTHGMFATIAAMCGELLPVTPPHAEFVPVGIVPFIMPGTDELAEAVVKAFGGEGRAVLLSNHGMICCGKDMPAAMTAAVYTEEMAATAYYAKLLGVFQPLPADSIGTLKEFLAGSHAV